MIKLPENKTKEKYRYLWVDNPEKIGLKPKATNPLEALQVQISQVYQNELATESTFELIDHI
jgi:hypothetical protein